MLKNNEFVFLSISKTINPLSYLLKICYDFIRGQRLEILSLRSFVLFSRLFQSSRTTGALPNFEIIIIIIIFFFLNRPLSSTRV